jgi:hypothetical protein
MLAIDLTALTFAQLQAIALASGYDSSDWEVCKFIRVLHHAPSGKFSSAEYVVGYHDGPGIELGSVFVSVDLRGCIRLDF